MLNLEKLRKEFYVIENRLRQDIHVLSVTQEIY